MVKEMVFVTPEVRKANRGYKNKPKSYQKGWRCPFFGEMNINVKYKGASHTVMAKPESLVSSLVRSVIGSVMMGDHNDVPLTAFFRKHDLSTFGEYQIRELFDGNETIYVKEGEKWNSPV